MQLLRDNLTVSYFINCFDIDYYFCCSCGVLTLIITLMLMMKRTKTINLIIPIKVAIKLIFLMFFFHNCYDVGMLFKVQQQCRDERDTRIHLPYTSLHSVNTCTEPCTGKLV